ncbi:hypothetical protein G6F67_003029 [Rhizopus microsporus]|nr:hypothetical protein G6F67_003029 [Rhizopus microsporus]
MPFYIEIFLIELHEGHELRAGHEVRLPHEVRGGHEIRLFQLRFRYNSAPHTIWKYKNETQTSSELGNLKGNSGPDHSPRTASEPCNPEDPQAQDSFWIPLLPFWDDAIRATKALVQFSKPSQLEARL